MTEVLAVTRNILQLNQWVTISFHVMFVNWLAFVVIVSRGITFITVEYILLLTASALAKSIDKIYDLYIKHDF